MIGGAIAEATLERFNRNLAFGVITTHYTNLKHYAEDAEGIVNGAMLYDRQHLQPLFQLSIGNPGSSFAVEIARKIGLPEDLIAEVADKVGTEHLNYDKHLQDIVRDKRYWENKRQQIRQKEKKLEETMAKYEAEMASIEHQRKEITKQARLDAQHLLSEANAKIENTIRQIKEADAEKEKTKTVRKELEDFKKRLTPDTSPKREEKNSHLTPQKIEKPHLSSPKGRNLNPPTGELGSFVVGSTVRLKGQTATGTIIEIQDKQALVAFGQMNRW